jgi:hypothetical protein
MGGETPETCWATYKRQVINLWNCCILLVDLFESYDDARTCERRTESKLVNSFGVNGKKCAYLEDVTACIVTIKIKIIKVLRMLHNSKVHPIPSGVLCILMSLPVASSCSCGIQQNANNFWSKSKLPCIFCYCSKHFLIDLRCQSNVQALKLSGSQNERDDFNKSHSYYFERTPNNWKIKGTLNSIPLKFAGEIQHTVGRDSSIQFIFKFHSFGTLQSLRKLQ